MVEKDARVVALIVRVPDDEVDRDRLTAFERRLGREPARRPARRGRPLTVRPERVKAGAGELGGAAGAGHRRRIAVAADGRVRSAAIEEAVVDADGIVLRVEGDIVRSAVV